MDWTLEVVVLPVSDIDRSVAFYRDQVGFELDHDTRTEHMHVVQLTPRGSGCSIVFGDLPAAGATRWRVTPRRSCVTSAMASCRPRRLARPTAPSCSGARRPPPRSRSTWRLPNDGAPARSGHES